MGDIHDNNFSCTPTRGMCTRLDMCGHKFEFELGSLHEVDKIPLSLESIWQTADEFCQDLSTWKCVYIVSLLLVCT
jgi:hypothetical protein